AIEGGSENRISHGRRVLVKDCARRATNRPNHALLQVGPGSHATGRRREGSRPLTADPVVHVPILGTRPDLRRDGGRGVYDHAAPFRGLRERVDVEQVGPPWLASEGSDGRVPGFRPREAARHMTVAHEHDRKGTVPWDVIKKAHALGLDTAFIPEAYGGGGIDSTLTHVIVTEELNWGCAGMATGLIGAGLAYLPIIHMGTEEQKKR